MKRTVLTMLVMLSLVASIASAHQHEKYKIGNDYYEITIGSMNEPVFVDDKSGVEFSIAKVPAAEVEEHDDSAGEHEEGTPVTGLETTLKVEISAGDKKKVLDIKPTWGEAGSYYAPFYPTVATTYTYRVFGTINNVPVDLSFGCNPAGHPQTTPDSNELKISDQVTRISKQGAFGCPQPRDAVSFPEPVQAGNELTTKVAALEQAQSSPKSSSNSMTWIALVLGAVGTAMGIIAFQRSRKA